MQSSKAEIRAYTITYTYPAIGLCSAFAGSPLKATGYSGFNAEITGAAFPGGSWNYTDLATFFWSSTPHGTDKAMANGMNSYHPSVSRYPALRANAFSVRCVRD